MHINPYKLTEMLEAAYDSGVKHGIALQTSAKSGFIACTAGHLELSEHTQECLYLPAILAAQEVADRLDYVTEECRTAENYMDTFPE